MDRFYVHYSSRKAFFSGSSVHKEKKKWGEEHWIVNRDYCGKKLIIKKNRRCSMHTHKEKDEVFYIQSGKVKLELGKEEYILKPGDFIHISPRTSHRFTGLEDSEMFEFSTNHKEEDSYRSELSGHIDQEKFEKQKNLIGSLKSASVLVVGDVMLDTYLKGSVERVSPEAPIPVLRCKERESLPGGAANAARNVSALGGKVSLVGVRGADAAGDELEGLLKEAGVRSLLVKERGRPTTEKQRLLGSATHQLVRVDFEEDEPISKSLTKKVLEKVEREIAQHNVLLLSDYAKGVFTSDVLKKCIALAKKHNVPVILDPKPRNASYLGNVKGVTLITPNRKEGFLLDGFASSSIETTAKHLANSLKTNVLLTLGSDGMLLVSERGKVSSYPTMVQEVADVTGAGDTVSATIALSLAAKGDLSDAIELANHAAGVAVSKAGAATVTPEELEASL